MIKSFYDLNAWKISHSLVLSIYEILNNLSNSEKYALSDQIRRCAISITSNIAEGFSRQSSKEKNQFYYMAKGSLSELQSQLILAKDLKYISIEKFNKLFEKSIESNKLLSGLVKSSQDRPIHNT